MNTYIDGKKFQFITDYSKHACKNTNGEDVILDFGKLTIAERIMLSSFLTILCDDKNSSIKKQNVYDKIFNFNSEKKYVKTSYHDSFLDDLTKFFKENPLFFSFIKDNFDKIDGNETIIFRSQLNSTEMDLLYSLQFRRSYKSLMNVLYIIGVSKQNIQTTFLNKISLKSFYEHNSSLSKNRVNEIFEKINKISDNELKYKIDGGYVYFSSGFEIKQDEKFYSEEKKNFDKMKKEEEILNSLKPIKRTPKNEVKEKEEVKKIIKKEETEEDEELISFKPSEFSEKNTALELGDENLSKEMVLDYIELMHSKNIMFEPNEENAKIIRKFTKENAILQQLLPSTNKPSDICIVYHGDWIKGEDGLTRKKIAEENIKIIQRKILKSLSKLYDEDKKSYKVVLNYICKNFQNLFTNF